MNLKADSPLTIGNGIGDSVTGILYCNAQDEDDDIVGCVCSDERYIYTCFCVINRAVFQRKTIHFWAKSATLIKPLMFILCERTMFLLSKTGCKIILCE